MDMARACNAASPTTSGERTVVSLRMIQMIVVHAHGSSSHFVIPCCMFRGFVYMREVGTIMGWDLRFEVRHNMSTISRARHGYVGWSAFCGYTIKRLVLDVTATSVPTSSNVGVGGAPLPLIESLNSFQLLTEYIHIYATQSRNGKANCDEYSYFIQQIDGIY
jgi:hypothetical protein